MANNFVVKTGNVNIAGGGGSVTLPGAVTLGTPHRDYELEQGIWYCVYTIQVTPPSPLNGFDRFTATLQAPAPVNAPSTVEDDLGVEIPIPALIISGNTSVAGFVGPIYEPQVKIEQKWNAGSPTLRIRHPEPLGNERWKIVVTSGSPQGKGGETSLIVDAAPHPDGPLGEEFAPKVRNFSVALEPGTAGGYRKDDATGRKALLIRSAWQFPDPAADPRTYTGCRIDAKRDDDADPGKWYPITGLEADEDQLHTIFELPGRRVRFTFRALSVGPDGTNTYVPGWTPEDFVDVEPPAVAIPLTNFSSFSVTPEYRDAYGNKRELYLIPGGTLPDDPALGWYEFWAKPLDGIWRLLGEPKGFGEEWAAIIRDLPMEGGDWQFAPVPNDIESRNRDGEVTSDPNGKGFPAGTMVITVNVPKAPGVQNPPANSFTVTAQYDSQHYGGKTVLELIPNFPEPTDTTWQKYEFWAKREDNVWYLLGYPKLGGEVDQAQIEHLPATAYAWEFRLVPINGDGLNADGETRTTPDDGFPAGTLSFTLTIQPPNVAAPVGNVTMHPDQPVFWAYAESDWFGRNELVFYPQFSVPNDPSFQYVEIWMFYAPENKWRIVGYPSEGGSNDFPSGLRHSYRVASPTGPTKAKFAFIAYDTSGRNRSGKREVTFPNWTDIQDYNFNGWPPGTPVVELDPIDPTTAKLNGNHIANIPVAALANGVLASRVVTARPTLPSAAFPPGMILILDRGTGLRSEMYRVDQTGNDWTQFKGEDLAVDSVTAIQIAAGAIGTLELATTELLVGPGGSRSPRFAVRDLSNTLLAFIGQVTTAEGFPVNFQGLYARNIKIAPGLASTDKYLECDGTNLTLKGATINFELNGVRTTIDNTMDTNYGAYTGLVCRDTATFRRSLITAGGLATMNNLGHKAFEAYADAGTGHGTLVVYNYSGGALNVISLNGVDGSVRAKGFSCGPSFPGMGSEGFPVTISFLKPGGGTGTLTFRGGLGVATT